jgi:hypothetical protein
MPDRTLAYEGFDPAQELSREALGTLGNLVGDYLAYSSRYALSLRYSVAPPTSSVRAAACRLPLLC